MKLLRSSKKVIRPKQKSLIKFKRAGNNCLIVVDGWPVFEVGVYKNDDLAVNACWRVIGAM